MEKIFTCPWYVWYNKKIWMRQTREKADGGQVEEEAYERKV